MVLEPPQGGEQDELHVGEPMWRQRRADPSLPREGDAPEEEAGTLLRRPMLGGWGRVCYAERSLASASNDAIVAGKSAMMIGPSCLA